MGKEKETSNDGGGGKNLREKTCGGVRIGLEKR